MRKTLRTVFVQVHLWLGLTAGLVLVLLGLTGSALVFHQHLDQLADPARLRSETTGSRVPLQQAVEAARATYTGTATSSWLMMPAQDDGVYTVRFDEAPPDGGRRRIVYALVDPATGAVLGQRVWGEYLMSWIYELHYALHLGAAGETAVGFFGLLLTVSLLTGVYLWWPTLRAKARRALTVKWRARGFRLHQDLHNAGGVYAGAVLLIVAVSGACMVFAGPVFQVVDAFAATTPYPTDLASTPTPEKQPIPVDRAVAVAQDVFPGAETHYLGLPLDRTGVYRVFVRQAGEVNRTNGQSQVWLDQYSGEVLAVRDWTRLTAADRLLAWMFPLHNGEAFGLLGRWLVFVSGFVPLLLYVTGVRIWLHHRAAARLRARRERAADAEPQAAPRPAPRRPAAVGTR